MSFSQYSSSYILLLGGRVPVNFLLILIFWSWEVRCLEIYSSSYIILQGGCVLFKIFFFFYSPQVRQGTCTFASSSYILFMGGKVSSKIFFFFYSLAGRVCPFKNILLLLFSSNEVGYLYIFFLFLYSDHGR